MSLKPLQTHITAVSSLYAPYTASGGGGGGTNLVASTLAVSSILGGGPGQTLEFPNGFQLPDGASIQLAGGAAGSVGDIQFTGNNGQVLGLSTINGAPVRGLSTITTSGGNFGDAAANLDSLPIPLSTGRWYLASLEITDMTFTTQPNATDAFSVSFEDGANQTNLGTFNMSQISTNRGILGDMGVSVCGPFEALSTFGNFVYKPNTGAPSTFIVTGGTGWALPLN